MGETGIDQLLHLRAGFAGQVAGKGVLAGAAGGGEPDAKRSREGFAHAALEKQGSARLPGGGRPEHVLVVRLGFRVELDRAPALPARTPRGLRSALELDARAIREHLERLSEIDALDLLDEAEEVTSLVTSVAVPDLTLRADGERRRLLGVEGAET